MLFKRDQFLFVEILTFYLHEVSWFAVKTFCKVDVVVVVVVVVSSISVSQEGF